MKVSKSKPDAYESKVDFSGSKWDFYLSSHLEDQEPLVDIFVGTNQPCLNGNDFLV
jgi:hypothetical protein